MSFVSFHQDTNKIEAHADAYRDRRGGWVSIRVEQDEISLHVNSFDDVIQLGETLAAEGRRLKGELPSWPQANEPTEAEMHRMGELTSSTI